MYNIRIIMSESLSHNSERGLEEVFVLDTRAVIAELIELNNNLDDINQRFDLQPEDLKDLLGADENDFLGNLAMFSEMHDIDHDVLFKILGIDASFRIPTATSEVVEFVKKAFRAMVQLRQ